MRLREGGRREGEKMDCGGTTVAGRDQVQESERRREGGEREGGMGEGREG